MLKILVIGAVKTTALTLASLIKHDFNVVGVLGHEPKNIDNVSGWVNLKEDARSFNVDYKGFSLINNQENLDWAIERKPDVIFAVGFSQLMAEQWLQMPTLGCVGFHPTKLPKGRGRAPIAWLVMENKEGAATFFLMGKGADDGPVFVQHVFDIEGEDTAAIVERKIGLSIEKALDEWLPQLKKGIWNSIPQNDLEASWYGKRAKEDGWIDWNWSASYIDRIIKASSEPHPGAYTFFKKERTLIWSSRVEKELPIKGVVGRVLVINEQNELLVQCGEGLLWISKLDFEKPIDFPRVGDKLGFNIEDELYEINNKLNILLNDK